MEECHDVLQAGRGRQAKAGKAPLFTDRDAVQQCCELHSVVHSAVWWCPLHSASLLIIGKTVMHGIDCSELWHVNWYSGTVDIGTLVHWYIGHWTTEIKNKLSRDKVYTVHRREKQAKPFSAIVEQHTAPSDHTGQTRFNVFCRECSVSLWIVV